MNIGILTISDTGAQGSRHDRSGDVIKEIMSSAETAVVNYEVIPDEVEIIAGRLAAWADDGGIDLIITTGGTGLSQRDVTPEATLSVVDRVVPGFGEVMRAQTVAKTPMAILSRALAGIRKGCLIINLPGSPKAVRECLEVVLPAIPHAIEVIKGKVAECAAPEVE